MVARSTNYSYGNGIDQVVGLFINSIWFLAPVPLVHVIFVGAQRFSPELSDAIIVLRILFLCKELFKIGASEILLIQFMRLSSRKAKSFVSTHFSLWTVEITVTVLATFFFFARKQSLSRHLNILR